MMSSRICMGYDNDRIYAVTPYSITSYDSKNFTTTTMTTKGDGALSVMNTFMTCFGYGNQLFSGDVDSSGSVFFRSYIVSTTPQRQPQVQLGSAAFATVLGQLHLNITTIKSMVPMYLQPSTGNRDTHSTETPCILASSNDGSDFNGLYQICGRTRISLQLLPFPNESSTTPLLATNRASTSLLLLGYPNANSIYLYRNLDDLTEPDTTYTIDFAIPSKGFVQVLDFNATELLIYDYNTTIMHIQLSNTSSKSGTARNVIMYQLKDCLQNGNVIALPDRRVFSVSDKYGGNYVFEEIPVMAPTMNHQQQTTQTMVAAPVSATASPLSSATIAIIIGCSVGGLVCILLVVIWFIRRKKRQGRCYTTSNRDDPDHLLILEDKHEPLPLHVEINDVGISNLDDYDTHPLPLPHLQTKINSINNDNGSIRNLRRGLGSFMQRMNSLRSPQSPTSIFSLFSNISSTPPPVEDKYRKVKQVQFHSGACELLEPTFYDTNDTLILNGHYHLLDNLFFMNENHRIPGYTTRTIQSTTNNKSIRTLHYFPKDQRNAFLRNINVSTHLRPSKRIIRHYDALALSSPTPHTHYQYYWITSLCMTQQSLHHLIHDQQPTIVDTHQPEFLALSVLSILSCLRDIHSFEYCHLGLSLRSFYYRQVSAITDWYVGGFDQAHVIGQPEGYGLKLDVYSAPELVKLAENQSCYHFSPRLALDCWSMGCIIYELATGTCLFDDYDHLHQLCRNITGLETHLQKAYDQVDFVHASFRVCLEKLLQVDPVRRASVQTVLDDWVALNDLDDDLE